MTTNPILTFGAFGPPDSEPVFPLTKIIVQLIKVTEKDIGNGKKSTTLTLWDGLREIGKYFLTYQNKVLLLYSTASRFCKRYDSGY